MAGTASSKSEEVRMWSGYGQNPMEIDGMFDLGFVLFPPDQLALEEVTSSTPATAPPLQPSAECLVSDMPTVVVSASTDVCPVCMEELIHHHFHPSPSSSSAAAAQAAEATGDQEKEEGKGRSGTAKQMPCGHIFHFSCISAWLSRHRSCPLCRHLLPN